MPGIWHGCHPEIDTPMSPWVKIHMNSHDPESGASRHCIPLT